MGSALDIGLSLPLKGGYQVHVSHLVRVASGCSMP